MQNTEGKSSLSSPKTDGASDHSSWVCPGGRCWKSSSRAQEALRGLSIIHGPSLLVPVLCPKPGTAGPVQKGMYHTRAHRHTSSNTHTLTHSHTYTHSGSRTLTCTHTLTCAHTLTGTRTHTHTLTPLHMGSPPVPGFEPLDVAFSLTVCSIFPTTQRVQVLLVPVPSSFPHWASRSDLLGGQALEP